MKQVAILRDFHLVGAEDHYARLVELLRGHDLVLGRGGAAGEPGARLR